MLGSEHRTTTVLLQPAGKHSYHEHRFLYSMWDKCCANTRSFNSAPFCAEALSKLKDRTIPCNLTLGLKSLPNSSRLKPVYEVRHSLPLFAIWSLRSRSRNRRAVQGWRKIAVAGAAFSSSGDPAEKFRRLGNSRAASVTSLAKRHVR